MSCSAISPRMPTRARASGSSSKGCPARADRGREGKEPKALRAGGPELAARLMAKAPAPTPEPPVATSARSRRAWALGLVAATLMAVAIALVATNRAAIVAWWRGGDEMLPDDG